MFLGGLRFSGPFLFFLLFFLLNFMAMQEQVALSGNKVEGEIDATQTVFKLAVQEVRQCLRVTNDSFPEIWSEIKNANSRAIISRFFAVLTASRRSF